MADYIIPGATHRVAQSIERSRFIATLAHAPTVGAARAFIDAVRAEFPDATHNCWAYACGPPGDTAIIGMSDAGEPHGTAGRPMLDVLLHSDVGEVAAVVTRYYGGVKLGKGGLARAYGGAVRLALESMPRLLRVERVQLEITAGYADVELLRRLLDEHGAETIAESYASEVTYIAAVPVASCTAFETALANGTGGRASINAAG
ncbi:MAG: YigZ family protein [Gemmatimonadota bacterium]